MSLEKASQNWNRKKHKLTNAKPKIHFQNADAQKLKTPKIKTYQSETQKIQTWKIQTQASQNPKESKVK